MKFAPLLAALSLGFLVAGCNSLDNPLHGIFNTGHDARVYNPNTGAYEWPDDIGHPIQPRPASATAANKATPTPTPGKQMAHRYYDAQKHMFVNGTPPPKAKGSPAPVKVDKWAAVKGGPGPGIETPKPKAALAQGKSPDATPAPSSALLAPPPGPAATPAPPWAKKATGYYNASTGRIEWGPPAAPLPKETPVKKAKKKATPAPKATPAA